MMRPNADDVAFDWYGGNLVVRMRSEVPSRGWQPTVPAVAEHVVVMVSSAAAEHPAVEKAIVTALTRRRSGPSSGVWLVPAAGAQPRDWSKAAREIQAALPVDVLVPGGGHVVATRSGLYAGALTGSDGWVRCPAGRPPAFVSNRLPVPRWERAIPRRGRPGDGVFVEPVLGGMIVRAGGSQVAGARQRGFRVALDGLRPRLVVDSGDVLPGQVAKVIDELEPSLRAALVMVPGEPAVAGIGWMSHLAEQRRSEILFNTGVPVNGPAGVTVVSGLGTEREFRPFAKVLRQHADDFVQDVVDIAEPPSGWVRHGRTAYRMRDGSAVADVMPGGLVLRDDGGPPLTAGAPPFNPAQWTLTAGVEGAPLTAALVSAVESLLHGAGRDRLRVMRFVVAGRVADPERQRILRIAATAGVGVELLGESKSQPHSPLADHQPTESIGFPSFVQGFGFGDAAPPEPEGIDPAPGSAGSGDPGWDSLWDAVWDDDAEELEDTEDVDDVHAANGFDGEGFDGFSNGFGDASGFDSADDPGSNGVEDSVNPTIPAPAPVLPPAPLPAASPVSPVAPVPIAIDALLTSAAPVAMESGPAVSDRGAAPSIAVPSAAAPGPVGPAPAVEAPVAAAGTAELDRANERPDIVRSEPWPMRSSTSGQQSRFTAATGSAFTDGLSLVNSALAAWPALRDRDPGAKADYVAVCQYLTRGPAGAVALNADLLAGAVGATDDYPACLVSGLGRLPVHRRVVLRQMMTLAPWCTIGTVLTSAGFLSSSVRPDVTVEGAGADLFVWPLSARRTSELAGHRSIEEAVFLPGRRYKVLAIRSTEGNDDAEGAIVAPGMSVLARELKADEDAATAGNADKVALAKLDRVWQQRRKIELRQIDDPDLIARLTAPLGIAEDLQPAMS